MDIKYPTQYISADSIFITNKTQSFNASFDFKTSGSRSWHLYQFPKWLDVTPKEGYLNNNSSVNLQFRIDQNQINLDFGVYTYPLIFNIEDMGLLSNTIVYANLGDPSIEITPNNFEIENTLSNNFEILNRGNGILYWEIINSPSWITIEKNQGVLELNHHEYINFTVDILGLEPGDYEGGIEIQSNASENNYHLHIYLKVNAQGYNGVYNTGEFIDAKYSKNRDQVIVLTKDPNRLLFFNSDQNIPEFIELDGVPRCLAMAEDENTLAVGFSNTQITTFETESHTLKSTYQASAIPLSLEFGNNQWMYFIANSSYNNYLHCLNLNNGEISRSQKGESGLLTLLKVPGKDLLVTTKPGYSPDYLFLYDISIGNITDSINEYSMPMDGFWLSDDGERLFTGTKKIFQIPDYIPGKSWTIDHPPIAGELELNYTQVVDYITQQSSTGKIFIATGFGWVGTKTIITQFDHKSFVKQKTYEITSVPPNDFPMGNTWWGKPTKLFPSPNGSKLWLIQKFPARVNNDPDIWSIQKLNLN